MNTTIALSLVITGLSLLISSGAVAFVFRYGIRLSVLESLFGEKREDLNTYKVNQDAMERRLTQVESAVLEFRQLSMELKSIAGIGAQLSQLVDTVKAFIPRAEAEARFSAQSERLNRLEDEVASKPG